MFISKNNTIQNANKTNFNDGITYYYRCILHKNITEKKNRIKIAQEDNFNYNYNIYMRISPYYMS